MSSIVLLQRDHEASPRLAACIDSAPQFEVAGIAYTVDEARGLIDRHHPDILVTDLRVQNGDVNVLLRELRRRDEASRPHVLVTPVSNDDGTLLKALRAGADGYWVHASSPGLLIDTLAQLARGESPMSPLVANGVLSYFEAAASLAEAGMVVKPPSLTGTEREILQWLAKGYLIDEIAQQWQASVHSVACAVRHVVRKLQRELPVGELLPA